MNSIRCAALAATICASPMATIATAQDASLDWKPMVYSDLRFDQPQNHTYVEIWRDELSANNEDFRMSGDFTYAIGNAPATEAHIVVRSSTQDKQAVLSVFNTFKGCSIASTSSDGATIKRCPAKIAIFDGGEVLIRSIGVACYVEHSSPSAAEQNKLVASYDADSRSIRLAVIYQGKIEEPCLLNVPVTPQGTPQ